MVYRTLKLSKNNSLFLFGARGTGKTTYLKKHFWGPKTLWIDLLKEEDEDRFGLHPSELSKEIIKSNPKIIVIDEVQKFPKLLDIVHLEIEKKEKRQFILSGSSARKLKRGGGNLLAGRAFTYYLHPFTYQELGTQFDLESALSVGTLPKIFELSTIEEKNLFLKSYIRTYLKEEITVEQVVRKIEAFRDFLPIAAQMSGEILNKSKISRDIGIDDKTVDTYFQILEETLIGIRLPSYHRSLRKQQREAPKFYLFDQGVKRALEQNLSLKLNVGTFEYGKSFEEWLITEFHRLNDYYQTDYQFSYLRTKDGLEIDLVVKRPGKKELLIEIKSTKKVREEDAHNLKKILNTNEKEFEAMILSNDTNENNFENVKALHWAQGLKVLFKKGTA